MIFGGDRKSGGVRQKKVMSKKNQGLGLQSSHSVKWQKSSQLCSSHQNSRVEKHELLTSFKPVFTAV